MIQIYFKPDITSSLQPAFIFSTKLTKLKFFLPFIVFFVIGKSEELASAKTSFWFCSPSFFYHVSKSTFHRGVQDPQFHPQHFHLWLLSLPALLHPFWSISTRSVIHRWKTIYCLIFSAGSKGFQILWWSHDRIPESLTITSLTGSFVALASWIWLCNRWLLIIRTIKHGAWHTGFFRNMLHGYHLKHLSKNHK